MKKEILYIGSSRSNVKTISIDPSYINTNIIVNKTNWASKSKYGDTFKVIIKNRVCTVQRTDKKGGWDMKLSIYLNRVDKIVSKVNAPFDDSSFFMNLPLKTSHVSFLKPMVNHNSQIPVYFINLDKDTDRLNYIQNVLSSIFPPENIHRIPGVRHRLGKDGCRLAHINAHKTAISKGSLYYVICEDDIKPIIDNKNILHFISHSITAKPDLVLFEQGEYIENKIQISQNEHHANLYRILGGGQGTGCYLCSKHFGQKLIDHWSNLPGRHIDHSWQPLWPKYKVFFHRPQLFIQRAGLSNQTDVHWRNDSKAFDWTLWEKKTGSSSTPNH